MDPSLWTITFPTIAHVLPQFVDVCQAEMNTPHTVDAWCQKGAVCIFNNINSYTQTELAGAGVMLGLAPATLAVLGPGDQSLAFLSLERPILSMLLASSTATLSVGYPFSRNSPLRPLSEALETEWLVDPLLPTKLLDRPALVSALQYLLAAAATANTVHMSYDITRKTIISWSCPNWAWVLCWSFVPLFLHIIGMLVYRSTIVREPWPAAPTLGVVRYQGEGEEEHQPRSRLVRAWEWMKDKELRPCSARVLPRYTIKYNLTSQILWWTPRTGSYLQYLMGIAIFSSILFVPISDTFPIIVRYAVSSVLTRCQLGFELQSLNRLNRPSNHEGALASPRRKESFVGLDSEVHRSRTVSMQVLK